MQAYSLPKGSTILLNRAIFKLIGSDAIRYLNGQCTQDVKLASTSQALYALVTNFKGKLDGDCFIRLHQNTLLIDTPIELREELFMRLDRYIIADDAQLIDITDELELVHTINPDSENSWSINRFGQDGSEHLIPKGSFEGESLDPIEVEKARISHAIPLWGAELDNTTLPPDAGLEARAISYTKGCYTGQEVISRMRSAGKTNRHLVLLEIDKPVPTGTQLLCPGATEEKPAGSITSCVIIDGKQIALAYRKRKHQETSRFTAARAVATVIR